MASLVKAMLTVNQRQFCPMINLNSPSKHFAFDSSPLRLTRSLTTLAEDARFLVGVNSLGDGGTNAHLLLSNDFAPKLALSEVLQRALLEPSPSSSQAPSNREPEYVYESIWQ